MIKNLTYPNIEKYALSMPEATLAQFTDDLYIIFTSPPNRGAVNRLGKALGLSKEHYKWPVNVYYETLSRLVGGVYPEICN